MLLLHGGLLSVLERFGKLTILSAEIRFHDLVETHLITKHSLDLFQSFVLGLRVEEVEQNDEDDITYDKNQEILPTDGLQRQRRNVDKADDNSIECRIATCHNGCSYTSRTDFGRVLSKVRYWR